MVSVVEMERLLRLKGEEVAERNALLNRTKGAIESLQRDLVTAKAEAASLQDGQRRAADAEARVGVLAQDIATLQSQLRKQEENNRI